jgi:thiosulfate/3-mercaptopyruvate sulfurtransferase
MRSTVSSRTSQFALLTVLFLPAVASLLVLRTATVTADQTRVSDPWTSAQTVQAGDFVRELADKSAHPATVLYVGFRTLFAGGHIPGATFHGSASTEQGMAELKKWADALPRSTNLVIYCGCCPFDKCPNIRPAFTALDNMGFKQIRVLILPNSFAGDWADKGYPLQKGQ